MLTHVVNGDDVRVLELRGQNCLTLETAYKVRVHGQLRREHLDGHCALERRVKAAVDHAHAAATDLGLDFIFSQASTN